MTIPKCDYVIFSDGSGHHADRFGGWAVRVQSFDKVIDLFRMAAVIGITVDRAEMIGMLEGLQLVMEIQEELPKGMVTTKPRVQIFSDRENMVLSIKGVYEKSNSPDLWARFAFYANHLEIVATHIERETEFPEFMDIDLHASTARIIAKQYGTVQIGLPSFYQPIK